MRWTASGGDALWALRSAEFESIEAGMFGTENRIYKGQRGSEIVLAIAVFYPRDQSIP